eukprot:TRINITY_DN73_c1_g1_i1.p1 TRINITY_DN73_c1_g1~~TRINITY_DN73_c1_g1_i1.p1  ORF type:complete len:120 (-),score=8.14 TRINITY_DN73_c1_g1_i1:32-355(-)
MTTEAKPLEFYSNDNIAHNNRIATYSQTLISLIVGVATGILSITGFAGFACYLVGYMLTSGLIVLKMGNKTENYFKSVYSFFMDGLSEGFLTFILFWTLAYDMVHLF